MTIERETAEPIHVTALEVDEHVDHSLAAEAARLAAEAQATGLVHCRRLTLPLPFGDGWMRVMAASIEPMNVFGYKEFHLSETNRVRYAVHVFRLSDGQPLGVVDAALITTWRTAASATVAAENYFGVNRQLRLGVVGTGAEALAGVKALATVFDLHNIRVTSRAETNRAKFVAALEEFGLPSRAFTDARAVCAGADLIYVATNSGGEVVLTVEDVAGAPFVASIGSTLPIQRELDARVLTAAHTVVIDTPDVLEESGDAIAAGADLDHSRVCLLGQMPQRTWSPADGQTVYKSIGSPDQDLALASRILDAAHDRGFGRPMRALSDIKINL